jgi:hypothetical protein
MQYRIFKFADGFGMYRGDTGPHTGDEPGEVILVFDAETHEQAGFVYNQFLHFEPYNPFDPVWYVKVGHWISIAGVIKTEDNYEERTLIVLAYDEAEAIAKVTAEAQAYSKPYKNCDDQDVAWTFDRIFEVKPMDFFRTIDLYAGQPVEIHDRRITKPMNDHRPKPGSTMEPDTTNLGMPLN